MDKRRRGRRATQMRKKLADNPGLLFGGILPAQEVEQTCRLLGHVWRDRTFTPLVTLWTFLSQVLNADSACKAAVARVLSFLSVTRGLVASHDPSAYCKARKRLPAGLLPHLTRHVAGGLAAKVEPHHLWHGHRVKLVDGSSVALWDSRKNQAKYPQPSCQKPGCGFPVARIVGIFDLLTGALVDLAMGPLKVAETTLFHAICRAVHAGEVLVGDRNFCSYADIVRFQRQGADVVFRLHSKRKVDFRKAQRLGRRDYLVEWPKCRRPLWLSKEDYQALPATLTVRVVRVRCRVPGWRADEILLVTTLLDPKAYPACDIGEVFLRRWNVETDFDHLKTTMNMEFLRTRSPEMVERELWAHLLAYNLIRTLMWDAAVHRRVPPMTLSFKGSIQEMVALWPFSVVASRERDLTDFYEALLRGIGFHRIPHRPHRSEPRVRKRRPKNYPVMGAPRHECRKGHASMHA